MAKYEDDIEMDAPVTTRRSRPAIEEDDVVETPRRTRPRIEEDEPETPRKTTKKAGRGEDEAPTPQEPMGVELDFGDERVTKRLGRLERLTLDGAKAVRFAFIPGFKPRGDYNHYVEGQGTFICASTRDPKTGAPIGDAPCCKALGNASWRGVALVVHYENAKTKDGSLPRDREGNYEPLSCEVKSLRMSRTNFGDLSKLPMEEETLFDFDIVMAEKENGIGYQFRKISKTSTWNLDEELEAEVLEAAEKFRDGKALGYGLGRKVDNLEWKAMLKKVRTAQEEDGEEI